MRLKRFTNLEAFFEKVHQCQGNVIFYSDENDQLNLKSSLCLYLFSAAYTDNTLHLSGRIECQLPEDEKLLSEFLEEETNG